VRDLKASNQEIDFGNGQFQILLSLSGFLLFTRAVASEMIVSSEAP